MKIERARVIAQGAVQGVGLRPFVYRLATELTLQGWVLNSVQGVIIEVEGERPRLDEFLVRLQREKPPRAFIQSLEWSMLDAAGHQGFEIRYSEDRGAKTVLILPDIGTCADCLREIFDAGNRRHLYPFTNCTNCGPRFSIVESLPYDRANTSMKKFAMCPDCDREYHNPRDRRFHAQPNACPKCGPQLELWDEAGGALAQRHDALLLAAEAVREGRIVALKGVGGFQLIVDARNESAVRRLRERKQREEKPFALMFPSLEAVRASCRVNDFEACLLKSPEAPIVLLERKRTSDKLQRKVSIAPVVAPGNPWLGAMLPYSPLHHLLMRMLDFPIVATSGNLSGEPISIDEAEALSRLRGVADLFLVHNRPIVRQLDDSVARIIRGRTQILRRARGYAPLPISLTGRNGKKSTGHGIDEIADEEASTATILGVGAHLKNTVALAVGRHVFLSQHIGDLETGLACEVFQKTAVDFQKLYDTAPSIIVCDSHPEYLSTKLAQTWTRPAERGDSPTLMRVQHHHAHILACAAENEIELPLLGLAWDGTGLGDDGKIWGGEFLTLDKTGFKRIAHLREFRLPGGEAAIKQPRRAALGLLWEIFGEELFADPQSPVIGHFSGLELLMIQKMLSQKINSPVTTSMGRLFDGVASIIGLRQRSNFEGQPAMELEFAAHGTQTDEGYGLKLTKGSAAAIVLDWQPMILEILEDVRRGVPGGMISAKFHNGIVEAAVAVAQRVNLGRVALSGGCFQNKYLIERTIARLEAEGFRPYWHQRVPPNDGGIALGQVVAARGLSSGNGGTAAPAIERERSRLKGHAAMDAQTT